MPYQGLRRRAFCKIEIDGDDVTDAFDPHLISVQVCERFGKEGDTCAIELDDRDGRLAIPPDHAPIKIYLGWANETLKVVFNGLVCQVESGFARRGGGRRLWVEASGFEFNGKSRDHVRNNWGDGDGEEISVKDVLEKAAKHAGLEMKVAPFMADIKRKYWAQNESFQAFGTRLAQELGGAFKISGSMAMFVNLTDGLNVDGQPMPTVEAIWGANLISWRIKPFVARPQAAKAQLAQFDKKLGAWGEVLKAIGGDGPFGRTQSMAGLPAPAATMQVGEQLSEGMAQGSEYGRGTGACVINGEPTAKVSGSLKMIGSRAGVDGLYEIEEVEHNYSRSGGYITQCSLVNPRLDLSTGAYGPETGWPEKPPPAKSKAQLEAERLDAERRLAQAMADIGGAEPIPALAAAASISTEGVG